MARYLFKKKEKLTGKKNIDQLFQTGHFFKIDSFKIIWQVVENCISENNSRLLISVPKKTIKKSVNRNLIKRRIREAYRTNKISHLNFLKENNISVHWGVIYLSTEIPSFREIKKNMILILHRLDKEIGHKITNIIN